jgi:circadian clock protein KaiC
MTSGVTIAKLPSGVTGLDEVLGGGVPELSFNLIVGGPGCGKTTLGHQIAFNNATKERPALYLTIIGEPPLKMLRYQQQFSFFDAAKVGDAVRFLHLGEEAVSGGLGHVLDRIIEEVARTNPSIVVVDSFRSMMRETSETTESTADVQDFIQRLALHLTTCEATTFLIGELAYDTAPDSPIFTVADGIITVTQCTDRNSVVRKLQVVKMRGQGQIAGLHTMRITPDGVSVFPRLLKPDVHVSATPLGPRLATGVSGLDEMFGGGIPSGYSVLVCGPSGSGKTLLSNEFILEGGRHGEPGIIAVFERGPNHYLHTTPFGTELQRLMREKKLEILYLRPLDLSIDETLLEIRNAVTRIGAKRVIIDSLSGLELALAPTFREDFRESLYRMVGALTGVGATLMSTVELDDSYDDLRLSPQGIAFLSDAIVMQRYVEIDAQLRRVMAVVKVRGSDHSKEMREYVIGKGGRLGIGAPLRDHEGLLTGTPRLHAPAKDQ